MHKVVTVVDYGIGNIFSVTRALEHCGAQVHLTSKAQDVVNASRLVLPGVGAFLNGMQGLSDRGLIEPLREYAESNKPMLGICLGMQMLFTESLEFGQHEGLGIIEGKIEQIKPFDTAGNALKVPHIGWSPLTCPTAKENWGDSILKHIDEQEHCYFVHSFTAIPKHESHRLADTQYGSSRISAAVKKGNVYGCQFHPEKSGTAGLKIVKGFLEI